MEVDTLDLPQIQGWLQWPLAMVSHSQNVSELSVDTSAVSRMLICSINQFDKYMAFLMFFCTAESHCC